MRRQVRPPQHTAALPEEAVPRAVAAAVQVLALSPAQAPTHCDPAPTLSLTLTVRSEWRSLAEDKGKV